MVTFAQRLTIAIPATAAGIFALLAAFRVIPGEFHSPPWVVALCGCLFLVGAVVALRGTESDPGILGPVAAAILVDLFAVIGTWVAFGPGSHSVHVSGFASNSGLGHLPFPITAVVFDLIGAVMTIDAVRAVIARVSR